MGEFIFFLVVAGAGFAVGRLTSRRRRVPGGNASGAYGYGRTLPHPAQIFEEGYAAGRRDAAPGAEPSVTPHISVTPHASLTRQGTPASQAAPGPETRLPPLLLPPVPPAPRTSPVAPASAVPESYVPRPAVPESYVPRPAVPHSPNPPLSAPSSGPPQRMPAGPGAPGPGNPVLSEPVSRVPHAPVIPPQRPPLTEAELTEQKRRRDLRNINITLYSGSLLLVAAAALFIGISIPEQARFAGVAALAALFYASGLVIHSRKKALRPAAVAFTGTGLALIPVVGLAFYNLILPDPVLAWLITSVAGTAAFAYAAARLESRVVSYLALTFLLSTALASGATLRSGIVWYFICTVLLATLISLAAIRKPGWLLNIYLEAFVTSHRFLVPATAAAAVLTAPDLGAGPLALLFLTFAAYYGVLLWQGPQNQALLHSYGLRSAATAGFAILTFRLTDSWQATLLAAAVLLGAQTGLLFIGRERYLQSAAGADLPGTARSSQPPGDVAGGSRQKERAGQIYLADLLGILALQFFTGTAAAAVYALDSQAGSGESTLFALSAAAVQLTLCASAWRLSRRAEFLAPAGVLIPAAASLLTPAAQLWPVLLNLGILTGFFVLRAVHSQGRRRAGFVLAARASAAVVLPLAAFLVLRNQAPDTAGSWSAAVAFLAAAGSQLWSVLAAASGRKELFARAVPAVSAAAAAMLAAVVRFEDFPSDAPAAAALWLIVLLNAAYSLLPMRSNGRLAAVYAPAGFFAAAVLGAGLLGVRGYGLLTAAALVYSLLQSLKPVVPGLRVCHFAAAQVLTTVLAALVAQDLGLGTDGVFIVVAAVLAAQHLARTLLGSRLEEYGPVHAFRWGTLLALAAVPPAYYAVLSFDARAETGTVLLLTAAGSAVLAQLAAALRPRAAGGFRGAPAAAASLVLLLGMGLRTAETPAAAQTLSVLWVAFAANLLTAVLHRHTRLAFLAPAGFAAALLLGAGVLGIRGYELLFAAALAYCLVLVRDRSTGFRGIYLAGAQATGTVLAALLAADAAGNSVSVFFAALSLGLAAGQILRTVLHDRLVVLGAVEPLRWGGLSALALVSASCLLFEDLLDSAAVLTAVLSAAAVFVVSQLDAARRNGLGRPVPHSSGLILAAAAAAALAVPAVRVIDGPYAPWALGVLWVGLGANLVCSLLLGAGRWELLAAAGFTGAALTGAGLLGLRGYELLVLAALVCGLFLSGRRRAHRGQYLLAAQLLAGVLALLVARDAGADIHAVASAGAAALAAAQLVRTVLEPRPAAVWARAAFWTSVGILAVAPAAYAALHAGTAHRDVVALLLVLLMAVSAAEFARGRGVPMLFPGLYAVGILPLAVSDAVRLAPGPVLAEPIMPAAAAGLVLAALGAGALAGHIRVRSDARLATSLLAASVAYSLAVLPAASAAGGNLLLAALTPALLSAAALAVSHTRSIPWLAAGMPPLLLVAALLTAAGFEQELLSRPYPPGYGLLWPVWGTALALQAIRLVLSLGGNVSRLRVRIMGAGSSFVLILGAVPAMAEYNASAVAGALTLTAALALAVREVPGPLRESALEAACVPAALAVERIAWFAAGGVDPFWSVQYWAVVLAGLAAWEYVRRRRHRGTFLLAGSAVILSCSGLGTVASGGTGEQLWALVAHAGLLAFGLLASRKLFTIWGAAGVALAVLWYLRGYTFLLLALLAAGLIALAVWRLTRVRTAPEQPAEEVLEER